MAARTAAARSLSVYTYESRRRADAADDAEAVEAVAAELPLQRLCRAPRARRVCSHAPQPLAVVDGDSGDWGAFESVCTHACCFSNALLARSSRLSVVVSVCPPSRTISKSRR